MGGVSAIMPPRRETDLLMGPHLGALLLPQSLIPARGGATMGFASGLDSSLSSLQLEALLYWLQGGPSVERSAIFVDAGYLLAAGGSLVCGTSSRAGFKCDYAGLTEKLANWAEQHNRGRFSCLRTYWYDGALNGVARGDHELIGGLPYVKVRLGRLIRGEQKGVDALIYRDLMTLARERAINCAYLLSGDEDLREGVVAAQDMGVQVVLIGIPANRTNQSAALIREADEHVVLQKEHWDEHFAPISKTETTPPEETLEKSSTPANAQTLGRAFAVEWVKSASPQDLQDLKGVAPKIPRELDIALVTDAEKSLGPLHEKQDLKRELRAGFWAAIRATRGLQPTA